MLSSSKYRGTDVLSFPATVIDALHDIEHF
jgi:hypothetical protein